MGLDNGIVLATKHKINIEELPEYIKIDADNWREKYDNSGYFYYDVCYWRKCWNIRSYILDFNNLDYDEEKYEYRLEKDHLILLQRKFTNYLCYINKWEEEYMDGETIWEADVMINHLARDIINLGWLINFITEHPTSKVIFYDSY